MFMRLLCGELRFRHEETEKRIHHHFGETREAITHIQRGIFSREKISVVLGREEAENSIHHRSGEMREPVAHIARGIFWREKISVGLLARENLRVRIRVYPQPQRGL